MIEMTTYQLKDPRYNYITATLPDGEPRYTDTYFEVIITDPRKKAGIQESISYWKWEQFAKVFTPRAQFLDF